MNNLVLFRPNDADLRFVVAARARVLTHLASPERVICDECYDRDPSATVQVFEDEYLNGYPTALLLCRACTRDAGR